MKTNTNDISAITKCENRKKIIYIACTPDVAISKTAPRRRGQKRELIEINGKF